jgi:hypothetical protein
MPKEMFILVRQGVYDQGIAGVYSSEALANIAKVNAKQLEKDNYHDFEIRVYSLDRTPEHTNDYADYLMERRF